MLISLGLAATLVASVLAVPAAAYEAPTTFSGGTGTTPGGLGQTWTSTGATTIDANTTVGSRGYVASDYTPTLASGQPSGAATVPSAGCTNVTGVCANRGSLTVTFDQPVVSPRLHIAGLGAAQRSGDRQSSGHAIFTLATGGVSLSKLSGGNLAVTGGTTITTIESDAGPSCATNTATDFFDFSDSAGCGSVQVNTGGAAITSLTFTTSLSIVGSDDAPQGAIPVANRNLSDQFVMVATLPQDYGDAPASYHGTNAPRHVISNIRLGSGVTEENASVANATSSPNTSNGDSDDGLAGPITLASTATTYSQVVSLSGASKAGTLAGWIDFNRNGVFDSGERATAAVSAGQTSATLTWSGLSGLSPGASWARFRVGYDAGSVSSPTGGSDAGEVEDWSVTITPPPSINVTKTFVGTTVDPATGVSRAVYNVSVVNTGGVGTYGPLTDTPAFGPGLTRSGATWTTSGTGAPAGGSATGAGPYTLAPAATPIAAGATHTFAVTISYTGTTNAATCGGAGTGLFNSVSLPNESGSAGDNTACGTPVAATRQISLTKGSSLTTDSDSDGRGDVGDVIRYTFAVTNTGNTNVTGLQIVDDVVSGVTCPTTSLAPNASTTCAASYTITQADVTAGATKVNTATATGTAAGQAVTSAPSSTTTTLDRRTSLSLDKATTGVITDVDGNGPDAGDTVPFTFTVTNTGTVPLTGLVIDDPEVPTSSCPTTSLAPGASTTCTATYTLTAADVAAGGASNTATASATAPGNVEVVSNADTATATIPRPPVASPDARTILQDVDVTLSPAGNDTAGPTGAALVPGSLRLLDPVSGVYVTSLTVAGQGTYTVAPSGAVTFDPLPTFTGAATPVTYRIADANGATATSTISITVTPVTPVPAPDVRFTPYDTTITVDVAANDTPGDASAPIVASTVRLFNPANGTYGTTLTVPNQGTYTVAANGSVSFDPLPTFSGQATAVTYRVADDNGTTATTTLTVTVGTPPSAVPDTATTLQDVNVTLTPLANDTASQTGTITPSSLRLLDPATGTYGTSVTIAGQGTFTADAAGRVSFDPVEGFTGQTAAVTYRATDSNGATLTSTVRVTVTPVTPTAVADNRTTPFATPITVPVLANDLAGDPSAPLVAGTVRLLNPANGTFGTTLTVTGEGTYSVNTTTGAVTFTPAAGYRGTTTPVTYRVADDNGTVATSLLTIGVDTPAPPVADPDERTTPQGVAVSVDAPANDRPGPTGGALVPGSVRLLDPATNDYVTSVTVAGQGTYVVDTTTGAVTFTPVPSFTGVATSVGYRITDVNGATATSSITVTVTPVTPTAVDDARTTPYETAVPVPVLDNDTPGDAEVPLVAGSVRLFDPVAEEFVTDVTVPGQGEWAVDGSGVVTFTPATGFTGATSPLTYRVEDANGTETTARIVVTVELPPAPQADADTETTPQNVDVVLDTLDNDTTGAASVLLQPGTVRLFDPVTSTPVTSVTVAGQGVWTVDLATGDVTFDPDPDFTGTTTSIGYRVTDTSDQTTSSTLTVTVTAINPSAQDDSDTTPADTPVDIDVLANDAAGAASAPLVPSSVVLTDPTATEAGRRLAVPGEGTWVVDPLSGVVTFSPDPGFSGEATPVTYRVSDANGTPVTAQVDVTVGDALVARPDTDTTPQNVSRSVDPLDNDSPGTDGDGGVGTLDPTSVRLTADAATDDGRRLVVDGEGTWTVDETTGVVTFDPDPGFTGATTPVAYAVTDSFGGEATSTITITVAPISPIARDDSAATPSDTDVTLDVLDNDDPGAASAPLVPSSVRLLDPTTGEPTTSVVVPGEGRFTVDAAGQVTFDPVPAFSGTTSPLGYRVADANGTTTTAVIRVSVGAPARALPDTRSTPQNVSVDVDPLTNDTPGDDGDGAPGTLVPSSVVLTADAATDGGRSLVVAGEGSYSVDPATGVVTFDPEPGFTGAATAVEYAVTDSFGGRATSTVTITVDPVSPTAADDRDTTPSDTTVTVDVLANDASGAPTALLVPGSVRLTDADATDGGTTLVVAGEGTWTVEPDGDVVFDPLPDFSGETSSVGYRVEDTNGTRASARVVVVVGAGPEARPDTVTTPQDIDVVVDPLADDAPGDDGAGEPGTLDRAAVVFVEPGASPDGRTLVVADEGTFTIDPVTGVVTFDPLPGFTGTTEPVEYRITDSFGNNASSTIEVTVTPITPTLNDDTAMTPANRPVTVPVLDNDVAGDPSAPLDDTSVLLTSPDAVDGGRTLVVAGQGTWTVDPVDGSITFTPISGFEGVTPPVQYSASDDNGTTRTAFVTVTVGAAPDAAPDLRTTPQDITVTLDPLANDEPGAGATIVRTTVQLASPDAVDGGRTLVVPGEGTWTVDPVDGDITFDPEPGFTGQANVTYTFDDSDANTAASTVTVIVTPISPRATDDSATTPAATPVVVDVVLNDEEGDASAPLDRTTVRLTDAAATNSGRRLVVAGEGVYTVDADNGEIEFAPEAGFSGDTTPVDYEVADDNGTTASALLRITVGAGPVARPNSATTPQDVAVALDLPANDSAGNDGAGVDGVLDPTSVELTSPDATDQGRRLVVDGQGTWTIDPASGVATFDPLPAFTGTTTPVAYRVTDSFGNRATSTATVTVTPITPVVNDDTVASPAGQTVVVRVLDNDLPGAGTAPLDPSTVRFTSPDATDGGTVLVVPGQGTWTVNGDGTISFEPEPGFEGVTTPPVEYEVRDVNGTAGTGLISITVGAAPVADDDSDIVEQDESTTLDVLANDEPGTGATLVPGSVVLADPAAVDDGRTLVVAGQGEWSVDPGTGAISFDPEPGFTGDASVTYLVTDTNGTTAAASVLVTVTPIVPIAVDDADSTPLDTPITVDVVANDDEGAASAPLVASSVLLTDPGASDAGRTLVVVGEGTYTVDPTTGAIGFDPVPDFSGTATAVTYSIADDNGTRASAQLVITVGAPPVARPDTATTPQNVTVDLVPLANDLAGTDGDGGSGTLDTDSVVLTDAAATDGGTELVVAGQGTWTVDGAGVSFDPLPGFTGVTTPVGYRVTDSFGNSAASTLTVTVTPLAPTVNDDVATTPANSPVTVDVLANDTEGAPSAPLDPASVRFTSPAATDGGTELLVPGQGAWTVNPDGTITFTPEPGFSGVTTPPVEYVVSDANGTTGTGFVSVVVGVAPVASPDTGTTPQATPVDVDPLDNDEPGAGADLVPGSVRLASPEATDGGRELVVLGEGTWSVDATTGVVTFEPEPTFTGEATVTYLVSDTDDNDATSTVTVTVTPIVPTAEDDTATTPATQPVVVDVLDNDDPGAASAPLVAGSVVLTSPAATDGGKRLVVASEGVYTVDPDSGEISFLPIAGFDGDTTPVTYAVSDANGTTATAELTITVGEAPSAVSDSETTPQNVTVQLDVTANDTPGAGADLVAESVVLTSPSATDGGRRLEVPGEGTWTVDPVTGVVSFDPEPGFVGTAGPVAYEVTDTDGNTATAGITVVVAPVTPLARPDVADTDFDTDVVVTVLANDDEGAASAPLVPSSLRLIDPATGDFVDTVVVDGQGTWTARPDGTVVFDPEPGFVGAATPVAYRVLDTNGTEATSTVSVTVDLPAEPTALPDSATTPQNVTITLAPLGNDSAAPDVELDPTTVAFTSADATGGGRTLAVDGEGTYTIDASDGQVTFDPEPGFTGTTTAVEYTVEDEFGQAVTSTITVVVTPIAPLADDDTARTPANVPVELRVLDNDDAGAPTAPLDTTSVVLTDAGATDGGRSLVVAGEGTWTVNPTTGVVTFDPDTGFAGVTTPVEYEVRDANGTSATALMSVTVGEAPMTMDDAATTPQDVTVALDVLLNDLPGEDASLDPTSVTLVSPDATDAGATLVVAGQGTWSVAADGTISFDPEPSFVGQASTTYSVTDSDGNTDVATVTVTVTAITPTAGDDTATTPATVPVTVSVLDNDAAGAASAPLVPGSVILTSAAATDDGASLVVPGEGTYTVLEDGRITFAPADGFEGLTTPVAYQVLDANGTAATAQLTVTVGEAPTALPDAETTAQGQPVTVAPLANDTAGDGATLDAGSVVLVDSRATDAGRTLVVPGVGRWTVDPDTGDVRFVPEPQFTGTAQVTYAVTDSDGNAAAATIEVTVTAVTPVAVDDAEITPSGTRVVVPVLGNDRPGAPATPLVPRSVVLVDPAATDGTSLVVPDVGTWAVLADGRIAFLPADGFAGVTPPVTYAVADENGTIAQAQVTVTVGEAPDAVDDTVSTPQDVTVALPALDNDTAGSGATLVPATVELFDPATAGYTSTVIVPGEGTWTVDPTTGDVSFDPVPTFTGPASLTYRVSDSDGLVAAAVLRVDVTAITPLALDDSGSTPYDTAVTVPLLGNDSPGAATAPLVTSSVRLTSPAATDGGRTLVVAGEGTWTIDVTTGDASFDPVVGFSGTTTPVDYQVSDANDTVATARATVTVGDPPVARDDERATAQNVDVTFYPLANDSPGTDGDGDPGLLARQSVLFTSLDATDGGRRLELPGEGVLTIDPGTGDVTFDPVASFVGTTTPATYAVTDSFGNVATAAVTIVVTGVVPTADDDTARTPAATPVTVPVLDNDEAGSADAPLVVATVRFTDPAATDGDRVLVVAGEGTYAVDDDGAVTFTPEAGFEGVTTAVEYAVDDSNGTTATALLTVTVGAAPLARADSATTPQGEPTTLDVLANDDPGEGATIVDSSVLLTSPDATGGGRTLVVPGEGTWTVDADTGEVTFAPVGSFTGTATTTYSVADSDGNRAVTTVSVEVTSVRPVANDDAAATPAATPVTVEVLDNDAAGSPSAELDPTSVVLTSPDATDGGLTLVVAGEGTYVVNPDTGAVRFSPAPGFSGITTPVEYEVADVNGETATALLSVAVGGQPIGRDDIGQTLQGVAITVDPLVNDAPGDDGAGATGTIDRGSVVLLDPAATGGGQELVVPGQGTWLVQPDGQLVLEPDPAFTGTATVEYRFTDSFGTTATATVSIVVTPVTPSAQSDVAQTPASTPVVIEALANDAPGDDSAPLVPGSVTFTSPEATAGGTSLEVPGEGTWTVLPDGTVRFAPVIGFDGVTTPVDYAVADENGTTASASLTVVVGDAPTALADLAITQQGFAVTVPVLLNDEPGDGATFGLGSVLLTDPGAVDGGRTLEVPGEGVWSVDLLTGQVIFVPDPAFAGTASTTYSVTDSDGNTAVATVTVIVEPIVPIARDDTATTPANTPVAVPVLDNDVAGDPDVPLDPSTVVLTSPEATNGGKLLVVVGEGTYTVEPDGDIVFSPERGFSGLTTPVTYEVSDVNGTVSSATAQLAVAVGAAPVALPDRVETLQGRPATVDPLLNDQAPSGATLVASSVRLTSPSAVDDGRTLVVPGAGTWTVDPVSGALTFTPLPGFTGELTNTYSVTDSDGNEAASTVTVVVAPVAPVIVDDSAETPSDTPVVIPVLANDTAGDPTVPLDSTTVRLLDPLTGAPVTEVVVAGEGTWTVLDNGTVRFVPEAGYSGVSTPVGYQVADVNGTIGTGVVGVTVGDGPDADPDTATTPQDVAVTVDPLANDEPGDGAALVPGSVVFTSPLATDGGKTRVEPGQGTWTIGADGQVTFDPEPSFTGTASVVYAVTDTDGNQAAATVTVVVTAITPVAVDDSATTPSGVAVDVDVLDNDTPGAASAPLDAASVVLVSAQATDGGKRLVVPGEGSYAVGADGIVRFTPAPGFTGATTPVTYAVSDANGTSATAVLVVAVGSAPAAIADSATTAQNVTVTVDPLANDLPGTGATLLPGSVVLTDLDATDDGRTLVEDGVGTWTVDPATGLITFDPAPGFTGDASTAYAVTDSDGNTATTTITVSVTPVVPVVVDDSGETPAATPVVVPVLANDGAGAASAPLVPSSVRLVDPASGTLVTTLDVAGEGTWTALPDGTVRFAPEAGFSGVTSPVTYSVADANGTRATGLVGITVGDGPDADPDSTETPQGVPVTVDPLVNDTTPAPGDFDTSSVVFTSPLATDDGKTRVEPGQGTWTIDPVTGVVTFEPDPGFTGDASVIYAVTDAQGNQASSTVTVLVTPVAPDATDDTATAPSGQAVDVAVLDNDDAGAPSAPLDPASVRFTSPDATDGGTRLSVDGEGTYVVDADGVVRFTPAPGFSGTTTPVTYSVADANGTRDTAELTITVGAPPVAIADAATTPQNVAVTLDPLGNDLPGDGAALLADSVRFTSVDATDDGRELVVPGEGTWTISPTTGAVTFTPVPGFTGTASAAYAVVDSDGATATAVISVEVTPITPTAVDDVATTGQDDTVTVDVLDNDTAGAASAPLVPSSVRLLDTVGDLVETLTVPGEGTWAANADGTVTFDPLPGFEGVSTPVAYSVADDNGTRVEALVTVTVGNAPEATPDAATTEQGQPVTVDPIANDTTDAVDGFDPTTVVLLDPAASPDGKTLVVPGEGVWTVGTDGQVTFTPEGAFTGTASVTYAVTDTAGDTAVSTITVEVGAITPTATDDSATTPADTPVTITVLANDAAGAPSAPLEPSSVVLLDLVSGLPVTTTSAPGEGTWTANPDGTVTFEPLPGFSGTTTPVTYEVSDANGTTTSAQVTVDVEAADPPPGPPTAADDAAVTPAGTPVEVDVLGNDTPGDPAGTLVPGSVQLIDPATGDPVAELVVDGEGTWTVGPDGTVTFTPVDGFSGPTTPVTYEVTDSDGGTDQAQVIVTVGTAPVAVPDNATGGEPGEPITVPVLDNDVPGTGCVLLPETVRFTDPDATDNGTVLVVPGEGTWTVTDLGEVVFTPEDGFSGPATPVAYVVTDSCGNETGSTVAVTVPAVDEPPVTEPPVTEPPVTDPDDGVVDPDSGVTDPDGGVTEPDGGIKDLLPATGGPRLALLLLGLLLVLGGLVLVRRRRA